MKAIQQWCDSKEPKGIKARALTFTTEVSQPGATVDVALNAEIDIVAPLGDSHVLLRIVMEPNIGDEWAQCAIEAAAYRYSMSDLPDASHYGILSVSDDVLDCKATAYLRPMHLLAVSYTHLTLPTICSV